jgi:hypothetical protein
MSSIARDMIMNLWFCPTSLLNAIMNVIMIGASAK